jgi:hypothetical protein
MARDQLFAALGGVLVVAGLLAAFGGAPVLGVGVLAIGLLASLMRWTRILQLDGKLRHPRPGTPPPLEGALASAQTSRCR